MKVWFRCIERFGEPKAHQEWDPIGFTMIDVPDDFPNDDSKDGRVLVFEELPGKYELQSG